MRKKILIVDDERDFTELVKKNLERMGSYEVRAECEGKKALAVAREFHPDLILLDIVMPDIPGGDVARQLKDDPQTKGIPIVFLTALMTKDEVSGGEEIGGFPFIAKPIEVEELIKIIEKNINK
ncbi:MAG: response regulator [Candidatus Omnitrophica bacterium 4484_70.1]|nr:MAG: response regulator [Candidatus Omnitrophica bacterium 4484_70.1]